MKKMLQSIILLVIIGMLITPTSSGLEVLSTSTAAEMGGTLLWSFTPPLSVSSVAVGDFNGDGVDDAVAGGGMVSLVGVGDTNVYAINGITGGSLWTFTAPTDDITSVAVGNFNWDEKDDVVAGSQDSKVYAIDGYTGEELWNFTTITNSIESVAVGDINGDGWDDVFAGSNNTIAYAINGKTGNLLWDFTSPTHMTWTVAVGDFDGDNVDDGLIGCRDPYVYAVNGTNGEEMWKYATGTTDAVAVGDVNGDGADDVITLSALTIYAINGTGNLLWYYHAADQTSFTLAVGDLNGDGMDDVLTDNGHGDVIAINGDTGKLLWTFTTTYDIIVSVGVGDVNGDGIPDVLVGGGNLYLYALNGPTGGLLWALEANNCVSYTLAVGDFNNDGVGDALYGGCHVNAFAGAALTKTKLEVKLSVSKTYVNVTDDWTLARAVVTNIGAFPAYGVQVICHAPDGTDHWSSYDALAPSSSQIVTWNLSSGAGLPTVKNPFGAQEISYAISVEVRATNCPTELVEVPIIIDPPLGSPNAPLVPEEFETFWVPISGGALILLIWHRKRRRGFSS